MPFALLLHSTWVNQGWRVKIRDKERVEPPHVTVIRRTQSWRLNLRTGKFMDKEPDPRDVPASLVDEVLAALEQLRSEWNKMYPENPA